MPPTPTEENHSEFRATVEITREQIKQGARHSARHCPVALALNEAFPGLQAVVGNETGQIALQRARTDENSFAGRYQCGTKLHAWIAKYDETGRAVPIRIELIRDKKRRSEYSYAELRPRKRSQPE